MLFGRYLKNRIPHWSVLLMLFMAIALILFGAHSPGETLLFDGEKVQDFSENWLLVDESGIPLQKEFLTLPSGLRLEGPVRIEKELPENMPVPAVVSFRSSQQYVRVYCDGEQLYSFGYDEAPAFGKSPGSAWNLVRLPYDSGGKVLQIETLSPYRTYNGSVSTIQIGSKAASLFYILHHHILALVSALAIFAVGVAIIIVHVFVLRKDQKAGKETLYLGLFSLIISLWLFGECKLTQFFAIPPAFNTYVTFMAMLATPVPLVNYIACSRSLSGQKILGCVSKGMSLFFVVAVALQMTGTVDFIQQLPFIHVVLFGSSVVMIYTIVMDILHRQGSGGGRLLISVITLVVFFLLEIVNMYLNGGVVSNAGGMMCIGVMITNVIQAQLAFKNASHVLYMSHLASTDALTGCLNRTSYSEAIKELEGHRDASVVMADINDLKLINDTYGHNMGDDAIVRCAKCFCGVYSAYGHCYRIGGDEFAMLGKKLSPEKLEAVQAVFRSQVEWESRQTAYPFSISNGYAVYGCNKDSSFSAAMSRADEVMYQNKRLMKENRKEK